MTTDTDWVTMASGDVAAFQRASLSRLKIRPDQHKELLDVTFRHPVKLIASALGSVGGGTVGVPLAMFGVTLAVSSMGAPLAGLVMVTAGGFTTLGSTTVKLSLALAVLPAASVAVPTTV